MKFTVKLSKSLIEAVQNCANEIKEFLKQAEAIGQQDHRAATIGILKDRVRDLRYEADLLEGVANAYVNNESELLLDKRIEAYAAYKAQEIMRNHEPAVEIQQ